MSINHSPVWIPIHGGLYHSTGILVATYICMKRGYKLKNTEGFASYYKSPGIPDIYVEYEYKAKDDNGHTRTMKQTVCIEIETHISNASIDKKIEQFARPGMHEPIIIDIGKKFEDYCERQKEKGSKLDQITMLHDYIDGEIVL